MNFQLEMLLQGRKNLLSLLKPYSDEQLNTIPTGFKNNLIWNLGHVIVSHQVLCYKFCGLSAAISDEYINKFRKGTIPGPPVNSSNIDYLKTLALETVDVFIDDYRKGIFKQYQTYQSMYGVSLTCIEDAIEFNNTHEGLHIGYVMAMCKSPDLEL
ncbi:MAG: hypothetical protein DHS20C17_27330 [Cyclobacteriaceae bacterium]|nr:MAG: hypothetical protein DHS20C17_27330 [Cyclobacteriaceae bacterium]